LARKTKRQARFRLETPLELLPPRQESQLSFCGSLLTRQGILAQSFGDSLCLYLKLVRSVPTIPTEVQMLLDPLRLEYRQLTVKLGKQLLITAMSSVQ
jgi:hypothetical protein